MTQDKKKIVTVNPTDYLKKMRKRDPELSTYVGTICPQEGWGQIVTPLMMHTVFKPLEFEGIRS